MSTRPRIMAHRGVAGHYPENTLPAFEAAAGTGAAAVELDIQLSADGVPMVIHDVDLERITGEQGVIHEWEARDLARLSAHVPGRFGDAFRGTPLSTLATVCQWLAANTDLLVFIELKPEILRHSTAAQAVEAALAASGPLGDERRIMISFAEEMLTATRERAACDIGWALKRYTRGSLQQAAELAPAYLFCDHTGLPPASVPLEPGPWQWVTYEIDTPALAARMKERGFDWVETMVPAEIAPGLSD